MSISSSSLSPSQSASQQASLQSISQDVTLTSTSSSQIIPASTMKRSRTSWIWDHVPHDGDFIECCASDYKPIWRCKHCHKEYTENGGTTVPREHLLKAHSISAPDSTNSTKGQQQALSIAKAFERGTESVARYTPIWTF